MPTAIVTGASQGFGHALASRLVDDGWTVIVDARDAERLTAATADMASTGRLVAIAGDIADPAHRDALVDAAAGAGSLELLVHNAGALGPSPLPGLDSYPVDELERVLRVNVVAPIALTQRALPHMEAAAAPAVVVLSSDAAAEAYEGWGGYGASKAALDHAAAVLGVERPDLRVYAFDPGDMRTAMHQRAFPDEDISDRPEPATVVPALLRLLEQRPTSGRYRASDLTEPAAA